MANASILKKENVLRIYKKFFVEGPVSKPEIVQATGLTLPTVHNIVNALESAGMVCKAGNALSSGGRRAGLYKLNTKFRYILGAYINTDYIACGIYDLSLQEYLYKEIPLILANCTVSEAISALYTLIEDIIAQSCFDRSQILGVGITVAGIVNSKEGYVTAITKVPHWRNVCLKEQLEGKLGLPVCIEKDTNGAALAIKWVCPLDENENLAYLSIVNGVGLSILNQGKVLRLRDGGACELGHISVNLDGPLCACGGRGCIELYACGSVLFSSLSEYICNTPDSKLAKLVEHDPEKLTIDKVIAAETDDTYVHREFELFKQYVVLCIDDVIKLYAPKRLIINTDWLSRHPQQFSSIRSMLHSTNTFINVNNIDICLNNMEHVNVRGGVASVLECETDDLNGSTLFRFLEDTI